MWQFISNSVALITNDWSVTVEPNMVWQLAFVKFS